MPVEGTSLVRTMDLIIDSDLNHISPIGFDQRAWILAVDEYDTAFDSIRCNLAALKSEFIGPNNTSIRIVNV